MLTWPQRQLLRSRVTHPPPATGKHMTLSIGPRTILTARTPTGRAVRPGGSHPCLQQGGTMASTARSSSSCPGSATVRPQAPSPGRPPSCPARRNAALSQHGSPACEAMPRDAELHCFPPRPTEGNKRHRGWSLLGGFQSEEALTLIDSLLPDTHYIYSWDRGRCPTVQLQCPGDTAFGCL